ncbi:MAG TPA: hypothetical protein VKF82_11840 [Candidatus Eremiobacteraceae bacterium]|nr:hypothetical protein [Candidatus Eremiobacteraceae bacterium]
MRRFVSALAITYLAFACAFAAPALAAPTFSASLAASPASYAGPCPATIHLNGKIVNSPDFVNSTKYSMLNSDGIDSFLMTATFDATHTYAVHDARTPSASGAYWVQILVRDATGANIVARSNRAEFTVRCAGVNPNATPTPCPVGVRCTPPPTRNPNATPTPCKPTAAGIPCQPTPCPPTVAGCGPTHNPNATPTPCRPNPAGPPCEPTPKPTPCRTVTGAPCKDLPDLVPLPPLRIGNPAHTPVPNTTWGVGLTLTDADAFLHSNGRCAFNIWYEFKNQGLAIAAPPFKNTIKVDGVSIVSVNGPFAPLAAGASRAVQTQAYLPGGVHQLSLDLDSGTVVTESNKPNNHVSIKYQLTGNCSE